jgi:hypothetical protein
VEPVADHLGVHFALGFGPHVDAVASKARSAVLGVAAAELHRHGDS